MIASGSQIRAARNQSDSVSEKLYPKSRLLAYRRPPKAKAQRALKDRAA